MSAYAEVRQTPSAELRTSLGLASLGAALCHLMAAAHLTSGMIPHGLPNLAMALLQGAVAGGVGLTPARWVVGPVAALNAIIAVVWLSTHIGGLAPGLPDVLATACELVAAGGAVALLAGAPERVLSAWSKVCLLVFAAIACTGFGHVHHG
jgi:hypothetical protein